MAADGLPCLYKWNHRLSRVATKADKGTVKPRNIIFTNVYIGSAFSAHPRKKKIQISPLLFCICYPACVTAIKYHLDFRSF